MRLKGMVYVILSVFVFTSLNAGCGSWKRVSREEVVAPRAREHTSAPMQKQLELKAAVHEGGIRFAPRVVQYCQHVRLRSSKVVDTYRYDASYSAPIWLVGGGVGSFAGIASAFREKPGFGAGAFLLGGLTGVAVGTLQLVRDGKQRRVEQSSDTRIEDQGRERCGVSSWPSRIRVTDPGGVQHVLEVDSSGIASLAIDWSKTDPHDLLGTWWIKGGEHHLAWGPDQPNLKAFLAKRPMHPRARPESELNDPFSDMPRLPSEKLARVKLEQGKLALEANKPERALQHLERAIKLGADSPTLLLSAAQAAYRCGKHLRARHYIERVLLVEDPAFTKSEDYQRAYLLAARILEAIEARSPKKSRKK